MSPLTALATALAVLAGLCAPAFPQQLQYPVTKKVDQTDTYFGVKVADPYRWLEDDNSPEVRNWVEAENSVTSAYFGRISYRGAIKDRLTALANYPKYTAPFRSGDNYFFYKNDGLQSQSVLYVQKGLEGAPEVFLDPNTFSADGNTTIATFSVSKDGKYAAYTVSTGSSAWQDCYVMEVATRKKLPDTLKWLKYSGTAWQGDGFYYSRYPEPEKVDDPSAKAVNQKVYFHKVGTSQSEDELAYEDGSNPEANYFVTTTPDERFALLVGGAQGKQGNFLYYRDLSKGQKSFTPIAAAGDSAFLPITNVGENLLIQTNQNAPNSRIILLDPNKPEQANWKEIVPEKPEPLTASATGGGKLFLSYLKDVSNRTYVYTYDGKLEREVKLPGLGNATGFAGLRDDKSVFYSFASFTYPPAIYQYDIAGGKSTVFRAPEIPGYRAADYVTDQLFYRSKDGARIPMFVVHKKGLPMDGNNPTLMTAVGGFKISVTPAFNSYRLALLEQGFVFVSANIRGGGEYGEKWHQAAIKLNKQKGIDDFIAAAEYLIANKYTSPDKLAMMGGSIGGMLMAAVENQRPELFKAAIIQTGLMDMLRFQKFTVGWAYTPDYGSSDNEQEFKALYAYSPLHNVREGTRYPATLITTDAHDNRILPAHSFKYAATLQAKQGGEAPILLQADASSGLGTTNTQNATQQNTDVYSFLFYSLGATPKASITAPAESKAGSPRPSLASEALVTRKAREGYDERPLR